MYLEWGNYALLIIFFSSLCMSCSQWFAAKSFCRVRELTMHLCRSEFLFSSLSCHVAATVIFDVCADATKWLYPSVRVYNLRRGAILRPFDVCVHNWQRGRVVRVSLRAACSKIQTETRDVSYIAWRNRCIVMFAVPMLNHFLQVWAFCISWRVRTKFEQGGTII
jgi:hypothetical protein